MINVCGVMKGKVTLDSICINKGDYYIFRGYPEEDEYTTIFKIANIYLDTGNELRIEVECPYDTDKNDNWKDGYKVLKIDFILRCEKITKEQAYAEML